jgi:hypothetical protein
MDGTTGGPDDLVFGTSSEWRYAMARKPAAVRDILDAM